MMLEKNYLFLFQNQCQTHLLIPNLLALYFFLIITFIFFSLSKNQQFAITILFTILIIYYIYKKYIILLYILFNKILGIKNWENLLNYNYFIPLMFFQVLIIILLERYQGYFYLFCQEIYQNIQFFDFILGEKFQLVFYPFYLFFKFFSSNYFFINFILIRCLCLYEFISTFWFIRKINKYHFFLQLHLLYLQIQINYFYMISLNVHF